MRKSAPYKKGDPISVLYWDAGFGTCLSTCHVEEIHESDTNGFWEITYTYPNGHKTTTRVNEKGRDRHGYVCRKVT